MKMEFWLAKKNYNKCLMLNVEYLMKRNNQKPNNYLPITNY